MTARGVLMLVLVLGALSAAPAWGAEEGGTMEVDPEVPNTLVEITGNKVASYSFFIVLAGFCLMLIFRGIRAR